MLYLGGACLGQEGAGLLSAKEQAGGLWASLAQCWLQALQHCAVGPKQDRKLGPVELCPMHRFGWGGHGSCLSKLRLGKEDLGRAGLWAAVTMTAEGCE